MIRVSVVVPTFKRPTLLLGCLEALLRQTLNPDEFEIIVADDAAESRTERLVHSLGRRRGHELSYVPVYGPHGPAAARNAGWQEARGAIIAFTDDDCLPDPHWLEEGLKAFEPDVVAVSGRLIMPLPKNPTDYELNASRMQNASFITANCLCRRRALQAIGGFDERFKIAWREDSDLEFRLRKIGRICKAADAVVVHPIRPAPWGVSVKQIRNNLYEALLFKKHPEDYRAEIRPLRPWSYYLGIVSLAAGAAFGATHYYAVMASFLAIWSGLTATFCLRRLRGTRRSLSHILEMVVTSMIIPPLAVYWRLRGAFRFSTFFL